MWIVVLRQIYKWGLFADATSSWASALMRLVTFVTGDAIPHGKILKPERFVTGGNRAVPSNFHCLSCAHFQTNQQSQKQTTNHPPIMSSRSPKIYPTWSLAPRKSGSCGRRSTFAYCQSFHSCICGRLWIEVSNSLLSSSKPACLQ